MKVSILSDYTYNIVFHDRSVVLSVCSIVMASSETFLTFTNLYFMSAGNFQMECSFFYHNCFLNERYIGVSSIPGCLIVVAITTLPRPLLKRQIVRPP